MDFVRGDPDSRCGGLLCSLPELLRHITFFLNIPPFLVQASASAGNVGDNKSEDRPVNSGPSPFSEIVAKIYQLESSSGKNDDKCHRIGKHNGYGYAQGVGRNFCLDSDDEVRELVIQWFNRETEKGLTIGQAVCKYNTGYSASESCAYLDDLNSI